MKRPLMHTTSAIAMTIMMAAGMAPTGQAYAAPSQITPIVEPEGKFKPIAPVKPIASNLPAPVDVNAPTPRPYGYTIDANGNVNSPNGYYLFTYNAKTGEFFDGKTKVLDKGTLERYRAILGQATPLQVSPLRPKVSNDPTPVDTGKAGIYPRNTLPALVPPSGKTTNPTPAPRPAQLTAVDPGISLPVEPSPPLTIDNEGTISHAPIKPIKPEGGPTLTPNTKSNVPQHGGGFIHNADAPWTVDPKTGVATHGGAVPGTVQYPDPDIDTPNPNPTPRPFGYTIDADGNVNSPNGQYLFTYTRLNK